MTNSQNLYKEIIFTNHALQRMSERDIPKRDVWLVWYKPDESRYATSKQAWIYSKTWDGKKLEVVAKKNEKGEWIILSVWFDIKKQPKKKKKKKKHQKKKKKPLHT